MANRDRGRTHGEIKRARELARLGLRRAREGRYSDALKLVRDSLRLAPDDAVARSVLGIVQSERGQIEEALGVLNAAITGHGEKIFNFYQEARSAIEGGSVERALVALGRASQAKLEQAVLRHVLELVYYRHHLLELAMDEWADWLGLPRSGAGANEPTQVPEITSAPTSGGGRWDGR